MPIRVGDQAPALGPLTELDGARFDVEPIRRTTRVLIFMSNACPGVKAYDARLKALHLEFAPRGVRFLGVNSIDERNYPNEDLDGMAKAAEARQLPFPYLKDREQVVARAFGAVCTPHVHVIDGEGIVRYRGRIDDAMIASRATRHYLRDALKDVVTKRDVRVPETAPLGCIIEMPLASGDSVERSLRARVRGLLAAH